jgi:hypothetical protein
MHCTLSVYGGFQPASSPSRFTRSKDPSKSDETLLNRTLCRERRQQSIEIMIMDDDDDGDDGEEDDVNLPLS